MVGVKVDFLNIRINEPFIPFFWTIVTRISIRNSIISITQLNRFEIVYRCWCQYQENIKLKLSLFELELYYLLVDKTKDY